MQMPLKDIEVCTDCGDLFPSLKEGRCELCYAIDFWSWLKETADEAQKKRAIERTN